MLYRLRSMAATSAAALLLIACNPAGAARQQADPPVPLPDLLRTHLRGETFAPLPTVASLPLSVRDALKVLFKSPELDLAEPGAAFQQTDVLVTPRLPIRRLIAAGCAADHCVVHYERGGFAHLFYVVVFRMSNAGAVFEWGGLTGGPLDLAGVREALGSGKVVGQSKYW
jgi:hypothetical protein